MTSEPKSAASGIDGAKCRRAVTAGREKSSRNALKHAFTIPAAPPELQPIPLRGTKIRNEAKINLIKMD
jgi:hypothetical protein